MRSAKIIIYVDMYAIQVHSSLTGDWDGQVDTLFNFLPTGALEKCYLCCFLKILSVNLAKASCISIIFQSHCFVGVPMHY